MEELRGYFAVHSQGLGHATRAIALVRELQARRSDLALLFLAGSPALDLLVSNGHDVMPMPPAPDWPSVDGVVGPVWRWYLSYARYLRVARAFLRKEADWSYYPLLISDSELASAREARRNGVPTALIVNSTRHDFAQDRLSKAVEGYSNFWFSRLARTIDLILTEGPGPDWPNVRRIGPVVRPFSRSRKELRDDFFFQKRTIVVTVGGTAISEFLLRAAVEAFVDLRLEDASMVVVSGPKLKATAAPGVYTYGFIPNLHDMILAADLVITAGGRETINEARAAGTPVIAIPAKRHPEAERNARELGYAHDDVHRLKALIPEKLREGRLPPRPPATDRAVGYLLEFLETKVNR